MVLMMGIGETLRETREEKGYTLEDIQDITKIQKRYLIAIEQNDFQSLPGKFYARAFIKEYAQVLELNTDELLHGFDEEKIQTKKDETIKYTRMERSKRGSSKSSFVFSILPSLIVVLLIVGIIFVAVTLYQRTLQNDPDHGNDLESDEIIRNINDNNGQNDSDEPDDEEEEEDDGNVEDEKEDIETSESEFIVIEIGTGSSQLSTVEFNQSDDEIIVELEATENSYVDVRGTIQEYYYADTLSPEMDNVQIDVTEEEKIYLNIGNAPGLNVTINGVLLEYPVDANQSVHQKIWVEFVTE